MKNFIITLMVIFMTCLTVHADDFLLSPEQMKVVQLDVDIFGSCVLDTARPFIKYGFTTEFMVLAGFEGCENEGDSVLLALTEAGVPEEEHKGIINGLFKNLVGMIDFARNNAAMEQLKRDANRTEI